MPSSGKAANEEQRLWPCRLGQKHRAAHRCLHGHHGACGGKEKMNCERNSVFNKLLRGTLCLFKSELCKQWEQKGKGGQG